jgi:predicted flap endonuclease-1-like 5' DNA nuclease
MPELTAVTAALMALILVAGLVLGWILRSDRSAREKIAINAGWQQQIESQQSERERIAKQNKSLMDQVSQYQASMKDSTLRAKELSTSLKETFRRRDALQGQIKDIRGKLEVMVAERDRLLADHRSAAAKVEANKTAIKERDEKIQRLSADLANWQSRVPPLVDRYRARDEEACQLASELDDARTSLDQVRAERDEIRTQLGSMREKLAALESAIGSEHTRIEPVDADTLPDGLDASNEPHDDTAESEITDLRDQVDDSILLSAWEPGSGVDDRIPVANPDDDGPWARVPTAGESDIDALDDGQFSRSIAPDTLDSLETSASSLLPPYLAGNNDAYADEAETDASYDDLRQIKGVGPAIEKTLNDLGFFRFQQIAEMTEFDIDRVARQLKGFRSRIYREDWIGQARMLQQQKSNSPA